MSLADQIAPLLPHLRRYARALTGSQKRGDAYVRSLLEAIIADESILDRQLEPRVGLYHAFHAIWSSADVDAAQPEGASDMEQVVSRRLSQMTPINRQALLLTAMEGLSRLSLTLRRRLRRLLDHEARGSRSRRPCRQQPQS